MVRAEGEGRPKTSGRRPYGFVEDVFMHLSDDKGLLSPPRPRSS